jgi:hypothetical protein
LRFGSSGFEAMKRFPGLNDGGGKGGFVVDKIREQRFVVGFRAFTHNSIACCPI